MSLRFALAAVAVAPLLLVTSAAHASDLSSCGNIDIKANAQCKVYVDTGCTAMCTPVSVTAACQSKGQISCDGSCTADIDASCTGSCQADCTGRCTVNPGSLDCNADCSASCNTDCSAQCAGEVAGSTASANCTAHCQGNCSAKCSASCTGKPPSADCNEKCTASCSGRCKAKATASCEVSCQDNLQIKCEADIQGGCKVRCSDPKGALFCDGQFVDTGDNLENCLKALYAELNIKADVSGSSACSNNSCYAEGSVSVSACSSVPGSTGSGNASVAPLAIAAGAVVTGLARRRRLRNER